MPMNGKEINMIKGSVIHPLPHSSTMSCIYHCRLMCIQRNLWHKCGCIDENLVISNRNPDRESKINLSCGYINNTDAIAFPEEYNLSHCFERKNIASLPECAMLFKKIIDDIHCMKRFRHKTIMAEREMELQCNCPKACESFSFDLDYR